MHSEILYRFVIISVPVDGLVINCDFVYMSDSFQGENLTSDFFGI